MNPATVLYEARMALADALEQQAVRLRHLAAAEAAELTLLHTPDVTADALKQAHREHMAAITGCREAAAEYDRRWEQECCACAALAAEEGR